MLNRAQQNFNQLALVAKRLGPLRNDFVFVGGCIVGLLIEDVLSPQIRPTYDVDTIINIVSRQDYHRLENKLRKLGFKQKPELDPPICAWYIDDVRVDIVPTQENILGFGNPWYADAVQHDIPFQFDNDICIRMLSAPYFIATKHSAFHDRGNQDIYSSHDLEDIIAVIDGRSSLVSEVTTAAHNVKAYIASEMKKLREHPDFEHALPGQIIEVGNAELRLPIVKNRIDNLANIPM